MEITCNKTLILGDEETLPIIIGLMYWIGALIPLTEEEKKGRGGGGVFFFYWIKVIAISGNIIIVIKKNHQSVLFSSPKPQCR